MSADFINFHVEDKNFDGGTDPRPFNNIFQYRTNHPCEALEGNKNYFLNIRRYFRRYAEKPGQNPYQAGDKIEATCFQDDGSWKQATFEVYHVDDFSVRVELITDWRQSKRPDSAVDKLQAKHQGFGKWAVLHENGKPFRSGLSKEEAERLVGHALGKQAEVAEAAA